MAPGAGVRHGLRGVGTPLRVAEEPEARFSQELVDTSSWMLSDEDSHAISGTSQRSALM